jgi:hypothetical protein
MESFVELGPLVTPQDLNDKFLPIIKNLVTDATEEEHRVQAAQVLTHNSEEDKRGTQRTCVYVGEI